MQQKRNKTRELVTIYGVSGTGKSHLMNELLYDYDRVIAVDRRGCIDAEFRTDNVRDISLHCYRVPFYRVALTDSRKFDELCTMLTEHPGKFGGPLMLAVDEIQSVLYRYKGQLPESFYNIIFEGRHDEISVMTTTQRVKNLDINIRSQYTRIFSFRQSEPADVSWLRSIVYGEGNKAEIDRLPIYPDRQFIQVKEANVIGVGSWPEITAKEVITA